VDTILPTASTELKMGSPDAYIAAGTDPLERAGLYSSPTADALEPKGASCISRNPPFDIAN